MKLLIATDAYKPMVNGVVISVDNLASDLRRRGHEVRILALSESRKERKEGDVYYLPAHTAPVYPDARWSLAFGHPYMKELLEWKPDIVHTQAEFTTFWLARRLVKRLHIPHVHTYHTMWEDYTDYLIPSRKVGKVVVSRYMRFTLKKMQMVITPTDKVAKALRRYGLEAPMVSIPTGIDLSGFREPMAAEDREALRARYGIEAEDVVFLFLGRVGYEKNIDQLIRLLKPMLEANGRYKFLIVGGGPEKENLEALVQKENLQKSVIFAGMVAPAEVKNYYRIADMFLNASQSETQGLTYIEALASGLPTICRWDPCLEGVIENGKNGFLFRQEEEFSEAVQTLLRDPALREAFSKAAKEGVEPYSKETFGGRMEEMMLSVIEKTKEETAC